MTDDAFGFADARKSATAAKLRGIQPSRRLDEEVSVDRIDAAGAAHGFVARDGSGAQHGRRRREIGPTLAINMRAPERVALPFIQLCDKNRYSYWEGIEEMMRRLQISASQV